MKNIRIDSRLQLLQLGGDRPYFLKSNEQLLTLLKKKNRETREAQNWDNRRGPAVDDDWRRDLELAKKSIVVSTPLQKEHSSLQNHFSKGLRDLLERGSGEDLGREYANHMIERNLIEGVQNEFLWEGYDDMGDAVESLAKDWDAKMLKLQQKLEVTKEPIKQDYDKVTSHKEFVRVDVNSKSDSINQKMLIGSVLKFTAQKNALENKVISEEEVHERVANPNDSQVLSQSMLGDQAFRLKQSEVMKTRGSPGRLGMVDKVGALHDWALNLETVTPAKEVQGLWMDLVNMSRMNLQNQAFLRQVDKLQSHFEYLLVKYGGYQSLVNILKQVHATRSQTVLSELPLTVPGDTSDVDSQLLSEYPLEDELDNRRARELLLMIEACHNAVCKERMQRIQESVWSLIERDAHVGEFYNDGLSPRENETVRLAKGFLEHTIISKEGVNIPFEVDRENLGVFGVLYVLFVSGKFDVMEKLMREYTGSLRDKVANLHTIFQEWKLCFVSCDNPGFFDERNISKRKRNFEAFSKSLGASTGTISNDIYHVLLVETFLQSNIASPSQTERVVDNYLDMLVLALSKTLSFGIQTEQQGWSIRNARKCLTANLKGDTKSVFMFSMEIVFSLMIPEVLRHLAKSDQYFVEATHLGLFLGQTGLLDVIDLFRDVFICDQSSAEGAASLMAGAPSSSRDFLYQNSFRLAGDIAQESPVECLLYLDLASPVSSLKIDQMINEYSAQENEASSASQILQRNVRNDRNKLRAIADDSQMIMLNKHLQQLKQKDVLKVAVQEHLFGAFFDVKPQSLSNLHMLRASVSAPFLKAFFDSVCSNARGLKLSSLHHARLLEEHGRPKEILDLFILQEHQIIERVSALIHVHAEGIQRVSARAQGNRFRMRKEIQETEKRLAQEIRSVCGESAFQEKGPDQSKTYLEKVVIVQSENQLFRNEERFGEAMVMMDIRRAMESFLRFKELKVILDFIDRCEFYRVTLRFSDHCVSSYLLLIHFHLFLLKLYHNKMIHSSGRWELTFNAITERARHIVRFYNKRILTICVEFEMAQKFRNTQEKIDDLINFFSLMN